jgi:hypothetical protein
LLTAITDLINEIETGNPPTQMQEDVNLEPPKQVLQKHRFSLNKKNSGPQSGSPTSQLRLFQSLFRSIKAADPSAKILPVHSEVKIFPLSTSDKILNLEQIGLTHYFKPYKKSQKNLAGDYYVQSKFDFEAFKDHQAINTWLMQYGYNITKNSCQTADMVRIGYLSRIRGLTLR